MSSVENLDHQIPMPDQECEDNEILNSVKKAMESLSEKNCAAVTLYYIDGLSQSEVANFLGTSVSAIEKRLSRSIRQLKEEMIELVRDTLKDNRLSDNFSEKVQKRIYKTDSYSKGMQFLKKDLLKNYEMVLALEANIPGVPRDVFVYETDTIQGVMNIDRFDPTLIWVSIDAMTKDNVYELLKYLSAGEEYHFQINREWMKPLIQETFGVEFTGKRFDYTVDLEHFKPHIQHEVRELGENDREMMDQYPDKLPPGHPAPRLVDFLDSKWRSQDIGARLFGVIDEGKIVSHVQIDTHIDEIWEIHPFTPEQYRGKGYAKSAMSLATQMCLESRKVPFYDAGTDNLSAMKLAERLGYFPYQEVVWGKGIK